MYSTNVNPALETAQIQQRDIGTVFHRQRFPNFDAVWWGFLNSNLRPKRICGSYMDSCTFFQTSVAIVSEHANIDINTDVQKRPRENNTSRIVDKMRRREETDTRAARSVNV